MAFPTPFTPFTVIDATRVILNRFEKDEATISAMEGFAQMEEKLVRNAPEVLDEIFWSNTKNCFGYFDICKQFGCDPTDKRASAIFNFYNSVLTKYQDDGFTKGD